MILQRGVIIETKTAQNDSSRGLYNGYFAWATGREFPGTPTFPLGPWGTQSDWAFGILAMQPFTGPSLSARIGPTGGYSSMLSLDIQVAQSDFMDYLRTRGIHLNRCRAWHYVILDGVFTIYGVGLIDNTKYSDTGTTLSCIDLFKYLHRDIPGVPVNTGEFPNAPTGLIGSPLPVSLGFVNDAKYLNTGINSGKLTVFINGGTSHTVTGCINASGFGNPTYFLVVGPGITSTPDWVGKTLVAYDSTGNAQAQRISTALFSTYTLSGTTFNVVGVQLDKPLKNGASVNPVFWRPQFPNEAAYSGSESWIFEVWDFNEVLILSQNPTFQNVGALKEYDTDPLDQNVKIFEPANQVQSSPYSGRGGITVKTANAKDLSTATLELWNSIYTPTLARFQGFRGNNVVVDFISSTFPALQGSMPLVINKITSPSNGYSLILKRDGFGASVSILVEVDIPPLVDLKGGNAYVVADVYFRETSASPGGTPVGFQMGYRVGRMVNSGKAGMQTAPTGQVAVTKPLNTIPGGDGYLFEISTPTKPGVISVNYIPGFYFSQSNGVPAQIQIPVDLNSNDHFNASQVFDKPNNGNQTVLVEILAKIHNPTGDSSRQFEIIVSQIGWVISRNALLVPADLYQSVIGEKYGDNWGSRRSTSNPVEGVPNIIEDVLRSFDGQPDYVDTAFFDDALAFRPALGPFGWFAGNQLTDTKNSADVIDEACKNALLAMAPGLDGKRMLVAWFDRMQPAYVAMTLDKSKWTAGSLSSIEQEDSQDVYSEFQLNYDLNRASGVYNKNLQINYTAENDTFPEDEDSAWKTWVVGIADYATAKALWDQARAGFLETGTKNRLVLDLPWLTDQFNGDPWAAALATLPPTAAAQLLLSMLVRWCAYPKRFVTGRIAITSGSAALRLLDTVYFKDLILTGNKRYYAWVTSLKVLESEIEVQLLWYPYNSPDEDSFLTQDNGVNTGYLVLDSGSDRIILN